MRRSSIGGGGNRGTVEVAKGSGGKLGCNIEEAMLSTYGWCVIYEVLPGTLAEKVGVKAGDRIVQCDDGDDDVDVI